MLSCGRRRPVAAVVDVVSEVAAARVGISPEFDRLDHTPRAMRFAQIAVVVARPAGIRQLDDCAARRTGHGQPRHHPPGRPADLARRPGVVRRRAQHFSVHGRGVVWTHVGTAVEAGRILYCHENTVCAIGCGGWSEHLGRSLDDPRALAELAIALEGVRTFPVLGRASGRAARAYPVALRDGPRASPVRPSECASRCGRARRNAAAAVQRDRRRPRAAPPFVDALDPASARSSVSTSRASAAPRCRGSRTRSAVWSTASDGCSTNSATTRSTYWASPGAGDWPTVRHPEPQTLPATDPGRHRHRRSDDPLIPRARRRCSPRCVSRSHAYASR